MTSTATLIFSGEASIFDWRLARLTESLGAQCRMTRVDEVAGLEACVTRLGQENAPCIMISACSLATLFQTTAIPSDMIVHMFECVPFVLVYGITPDAREIQGVKDLTEGFVASVTRLDRLDYTYQVSATERGITNEFSGLAFGPVNSAIDFGLVLNSPQTRFSNLISINNLPIFASFKKRSTHIFLLACRDIADLEAQTNGFWSTHEYFSRIVPAMMFLRHIFQDYLWHNPKRYANFIIDDPLLRKSYGFLNYEQLLRAMDSNEFTTTIAFIPWNYRRTNNSVARVFKERADRLSICLHGCNHTEGEFASTERPHLNTQLHLATQRMRDHEQSTGVPCAKVMVFPQGKFSTTSLNLLKCHNYLAAVNSMDSVIPADLGEAHGLTIADFLAPAISKYGDFPLFARRYPGTIADFAFDLFLGKPALLVEHHHYFKDGYDNIRECVNNINALSTHLQWTNLEKIIRNTYLQRTISHGNVECKIFANSHVICNNDLTEKQYIIRKHEDGVVSVRKVLINGNNHPYSMEDNHLSLCVNIPPESSIDIAISYENTSQYEIKKRNLSSDIKVYMRRYLSEFRDNYMERNETLLKSLYRVKNRLF